MNLEAPRRWARDTQALKEGTLVLDHLFAPNFLARPKYRRDFSSQRYFLTDAPGVLAPTNKTLIDRVSASVKTESTGGAVPIDLVTASASGLDPDITPAAALYQVPRVAHARQLSESEVRQLVESHMTPRQFGLFGEPRVNVLMLNLALEDLQRSR